MANRTGVYVAFHGGGTTDPTASDIKYYNLLKAWDKSDHFDFKFVNSHEKAAAVRDTSKKETLRRSLVSRLNASKNMVFILTETTKNDDDWVPFEISYAVDKCEIPLIVCYPAYQYILAPSELQYLWPPSLRIRIQQNKVRAIHIPFKQEPILDAINQFSHANPPSTPLTYYGKDVYRRWGYAS